MIKMLMMVIRKTVTHGVTISSIASWKKGFAEDIHMYMKGGRHDIETESANNKEQFTTTAATGDCRLLKRAMDCWYRCMYHSSERMTVQ
jgi:hypothetical protein